MSQPNIICLAIDRLHVGYLGAYGNTWINTPSLDRLASESFLLDRMMIDSPRLEMLYRSLWLGVHAMIPQTRAFDAEPLPLRFASAGWKTALITDETAVSEHGLSHAFAERILVGDSMSKRIAVTAVADDAVADDIEDTDAAALFAEASGWLEQSPRQPFFLWIHSSTLGRVWDAPLRFRAEYHDEDDPPPESWAEVPNRLLTGEIDPDELLGMRHAYAGQVSMIDQLVGSLIETLDQARMASNTVLAVFSPRGFPLAEHRRVGPCDDALYAELTHAPCFIRLPGSVAASQHSSAIVQPADLSATLIELAADSPRGAAACRPGIGRSMMPLIHGEPAAGFDRAFATSHRGERRLETPAWAMLVSPARAGESEAAIDSDSAPQVELFVKPDDWCEVNEVSDRCRQIVDEMQAVLAEFEQSCETGEAGAPSMLAAELESGIE